ncbi:MAG: hypothetical protein ACYSWU_21880, partial [Planctomycetota bacterium]
GYQDSERELIAELFGWNLEPLWYDAKMSDAEHQRVFGRITQSIDDGNPVLCAPFGNMSIITGYMRNGMTLHVNQYGKPESTSMSLRNLNGPPYLVFMTMTHSVATSRSRSLAVTLNMALAHRSHAPVPYENGNYWYGASAWQKVRETLSRFDALSEEDQRQFISTLEFALERVVGCRKGSLRFLSGLRNDFQSGAMAAATAIADLLQRGAGRLAQYRFWQPGEPAAKHPAIEKLVLALCEDDAEIMEAWQLGGE